MSPEEINRFTRTFDALEPRRKVYQHPEDKLTEIIALIKESISMGGNRQCDILNHIRRTTTLDTSKLKGILECKEGELWWWERRYKTTKHYHLINN